MRKYGAEGKIEMKKRGYPGILIMIMPLAALLACSLCLCSGAFCEEYYNFNQGDWRGGASTDTAKHPTNKSNWTKYSSKSSNLTTSSTGKLMMSPLTLALTDDTDTDFSLGTKSNVVVGGSGTSARVEINTVYQDPFCSSLGEWSSLPFSPYMGRISPLVKAGNYIYSLWQCGNDNKAFARWSIDEEKWELMESIPVSTGQGAALAYDGNDVIYALIGGNRKEFYAYKISTNTWHVKANVPSTVGYGGTIAIVPSIGRAYAFCGNNTSVFYRFVMPSDINATGSWSAVESAPFTVGVGASLCYPKADSPYIYATAGGGSVTFAKFDYTASSNAWTTLSNCPTGQTWDSDVVYPGSGDYLYAWYGAGRWFGRYAIGSDTWESSAYSSTLAKNVEMPALPFYINSRMYIYDPDGSGSELRLLSNHSYSSTYRYYPAQKKWREESAAAFELRFGGDAVYVASQDAIYLTRGEATKNFYRYFLTFNPVNSSNTAVSFQWEKLSDVTFAGNTSGIHRGGCLGYKQGDDYIYCLQGYEQDGFSRYSLTSKSWEQLPPLPQNLYYGGNRLVVTDDYVYCLGGRNNTDGTITYTANLYRYDKTGRAWTTVSTNPYGTFQTGVCAAYDGSDYIYMFRTSARTEFMRYRLSTGTWERRANLPDSWRSQCQGRMVYSSSENAIYYSDGGACNLEFRRAFFKYNISTNSWQTLFFPPVFQKGKLCASDTKLYNVSYYGYGGIQTYTFATGEWNNPLVNYNFGPGRNVSGSLVVKGDYMYLFSNRWSNYVWKYSISQKKWVNLMKLPFIVHGAGHRAVYPGSGDHIYVSEGNMNKNFWKYNTETGAWTQISSSPYMFTYGARMASDGSSIYVCPGAYNSNTLLKFTDDESGGSWVALTSMLEAISSEGNGTCVIPDGPYKGIYMLKQNSAVKFTKYSIDSDTWGYLSDAPWSITDYCYLMYPGTGDYLYCLKGGGRDFARYSLSQNSWTILTEAPLSVSGMPGGYYPGSGDIIYFYLGTGHGDLGINFNRYSISQNRWDETIVYPASASYGASICPMPSGDDVFYLRGGNSTSCYKYNLSSSVWYTLQSTPSGVYYDSKSVYPGTGDDIYVTRGRGYSDFWKYTVSTDLWTNLAAPPAALSTGQAIEYKDGYIYVLRGGSTTTFWRYSIADNDWKEVASAPSACSSGSNLVYPGSGDYIYVTPGYGSTAFWKYDTVANTWSTLTALPMLNVGASLFSPGFGDYIYLFVSYNYDLAYGTPYFYRYSINSNIWEKNEDMPFSMDGQANAMYPGSGDYIYVSSGYGNYSLMKYLLFSSGEYTSEIKEIGNNAGYGAVTWQDNSQGQIEVRVRTGNNSSLSDAIAWGYAGKITKGRDLSSYSSVNDKDKYLQYRLRFFCYDLASPPQLDSLTINYNKYPQQETLVSTAYDTTFTTDRLKSLFWTSTLPPGTDIRFQMRTAPDSNGSPGAWSSWLGPEGVQEITYDFENAYEYANTSEVVLSAGTAKLSKVLADYLYRQKIVVDNSSGSSSYANTTVKVEIPSADIDFWDHVADDGSDIRFTDSDGKTPLKYRVMGFSKEKKSASCWVTVPSIPQGTAKEIYLLYGKSSAASESDASLAESMIGTDFYALSLSFLDIISTDAPNRVYIEKLNAEGQVVASTFLDFTSVGETQRYTDTALTCYHVYSQKPITLFASSIEPSSTSDDDFYTASGNDLWLWCPAYNYDGDVIITAYNDDTQIKITDYGKGDDTGTLTLDAGNFWFGWNRVDSRGEVWHIEATKPITVQAGLIGHGDASEQMRSPDMQEYYFYCPDANVTFTAYEDNTNIVFDNLDGVTGDYSGTLNKGQSYRHIPNSGSAMTLRARLSADKPLCVVTDDMNGGKGQIYQSADTLVSVGKDYYINTGGARYLKLIDYEEGANNITVTGDISPSPTTLTLSARGGMATLDPGSTWRNLHLTGTKKFAVYAYSSYGEAITPVLKPTEFNHLISTYLVAKEEPADGPALAGWLYKETIRIDNTLNTQELTDFQVAVDVDKNHRDFWLHCLADGGDVRFVDGDGSALLNYYAESFSYTGKEARFWVKIPLLPYTEQKVIYMYYGKADAASLSDGNGVFEFFDDFDAGLDKWDSQYCNLTTISSIFGMDSSPFNLSTGASTVQTTVAIPSGIVAGRTYDWYWELRWPNGALVEAQSISQPFTLYSDLLRMTAGPFMEKNVTPGQVITTIGGTFTNNYSIAMNGLRFRFTLTDVDTGASFQEIDSSTFNIPVGTSTISNVSITMPSGLTAGHLYYWSWAVLDQNNNQLFSSSAAPAALFNIACQFQLSSEPVLPSSVTGGANASISGTFDNASGVSLNSLFWRFTLTDTTQGGRSVAKVAHNGYLQAKSNVSPNYDITTEVTWQTANKTGRHFIGICDPNAKASTGMNNSNYKAGYDVLINSNGYYYDESGNGYSTWNSVRTAYTFAMWNKDKMSWKPHDTLNGQTGQVIFELSTGDKLTYNAGYVAGPGLAIKPTIRSSSDAIYVDKIMVYKKAAVKPYVGFVFTETANPTGMEVYYTTNPVIQPVLGVFYDNNLTAFQEVNTIPLDTDIRYQVSCDGYNWHWWDGTAWKAVSGGFSQTNEAPEINNNLAAFQTKFPSGEFFFRAFLNSADGVGTPLLDTVSVFTTSEPTYYIAPSGSLVNFLNSDTVNDRWVQYKAILNSYGQETPVLQNAGFSYLDAVLTITSPNGGESLPIGTTALITWTSQGIDGADNQVKIEYSTDGGSTWMLIVDNLVNNGAYEWQVANNPSPNALIRITSKKYSSIRDTSDAAFGIMGLILNSPDGGNQWEIGSTHNITWSSYGTVSNNLKIECSLDGGTTWLYPPVADQRINNGLYTWNIPNRESYISSVCLMRITDMNNTNITDRSNTVFSIVPKPSMTITSPVGGEIWKAGSAKDITWDNRGNVNPLVNVYYSVDSGSSWTLLQSSVSNTGTYACTVPNVLSSRVRIRIAETAVPPGRDTQAQMETASAGDFTITLPTITLSSPNGSEKWVRGDTREIAWSSDGAIGENALKIEYSVDEEGNWVTVSENEADDGNYSWVIPQGAVGGNVKIRITDTSRPEVYDESDAYFEVLDKPIIVLVQPNGGEKTTIGAPYEVKWFTIGDALDDQFLTVYLSTDSGEHYEVISDQRPNNGSYFWIPPEVEISTARIKIKCDDSENFPWVEDASDADFTIQKPQLTLTWPNGGESLYAAGTYSITWESVGSIGLNAIKLEYSVNGGTTWQTIAGGLANSGSYSWKTADSLTSELKIRVSDDSQPGVKGESKNNNSIIAPSLTLTSPNGGELWVVGIDYPITWTSVGDHNSISNNLVLQYSVNNGSTWKSIAGGLSNEGTYIWHIPNDISDNCKVRIYDYSRTATQDTSDAVFKISAPSITITTPNGGEVWPYGTNHEILWNIIGQVSDDVTITYSVNGGTTWLPVYSGPTNNYSYAWTVPENISSTCKIKIKDNEPPYIEDTTDTVFSIAYPIITVTRPNGGEILVVTDNENITWSTEGTVSNSLRIEYSRDNFVLDINEIADNVANTGVYIWRVPEVLSTVLRVRITDNSVPQITDKSNAGFSILPFPVVTIDSPNGGERWRIGTKHNITWHDNGGPLSNNLVLQYSVDGGSNWKAIANGVPNSGSYEWTIPEDYSANAVVRITDNQRATTVDYSDAAFTIDYPKITITAPVSATYWAVGDSAVITWVSEGAVSDNLLLQYSTDNFITLETIGVGEVNDGSYSWSVPDEPTNNMKVRIVDGNRPATIATSEAFNVLQYPQVAVISPNGGEEYVVGDSVNITWTSKGLSINPLTIVYSSDNFATTHTIKSEAPNTGSYNWVIPDDTICVNTLKIKIYDPTRTVISDASNNNFRIRGGFNITYPAADIDWAVNEPRSVTWQTRGQIPNVKLDYSVDAGNTWTTIVTSTPNTGVYTWAPPDYHGQKALLKVSDPTDDTVYSVSPSFNIIYYQITWMVKDYDNMDNLQNLSVRDTWWSDPSATIICPVTHEYPYGHYTTFWSKEGYIERSTDWIADGNKSITLLLENSISAQIEWHVLLSTAYNSATDTISASSWLERRGKIVGLNDIDRADLTSATLSVYDGETLIKTLTSGTPDGNGAFWFTWADTGLTSGKTYFVKSTVVFRGSSYNSGASIDVTTELTAKGQTAILQNLQTQTATIQSQVTQDIPQKITQAKEEIREDTARILTATETDIPEKIEEERRQQETDIRSEILNRENSVRSGTDLVVRYRTYPGVQPTVDFYDPNSVQRVSKGVMTEVSGGIYEYTITVSSGWGRGDFTVVCSESTYGSLDAMIISVIRSDIEQIAGQVSAVLGTTSGLNNFSKVADTLSSQFAVIESALGKISKDLVDQVKEVAGSATDINSVYMQLVNIGRELKKVSLEQNVSLEKLLEVNEEKKNDMTYLKNKTQELKAVMDINQKMIDNIANKPVTQTWFEFK